MFAEMNETFWYATVPNICILVVFIWLFTSLHNIDRKLNLLVRQLPLSDRFKQVASDPARKIEAIKVYREETGASLVEAKAVVEAFIKSN